MTKKNVLVGIAVCIIMAYASVSFGQEPVVDVGERHGNMRAAQEAIVQAFQAISRAQAANEDQLGGHAGRAKDLLRQANEEVRLAANVANERR